MPRSGEWIGILVALAWLTVACAPAGAAGSAAPAGVDIRGIVADVRPADAQGAARGILGTVLVEGRFEGDTRYDRAAVTIRDTTRLYAQQGQARRAVSFAALQAGQRVEARFDGPVLESYPVQATAAELVILSGPTLALEPDRGPCATPVTARGAGFPAGQTVRLFSLQVGTDNAAELPGANATVAPDGTFAVAPPFVGFGCQEPARVPEGTRFLVTASTIRDPADPQPGEASARATFTVTSAGERCFVETGKCARGRFLDYWRSRGLELGDPGVSERESLALFGYPLSDEFEQRLEDGNTYTVQYFERARLEHHPEHAGTPYEVLLGQFGRRFHPADPPARPETGARYFSETGHNVGGRFLDYWESNGGLAQFGYPLGEPLRETLEDGNTRLVQYFERARFESHPENPPPYDVLLGQFGRRALAEAGLIPPVPTPTVEPCRAADLDAVAGWSPGGVAVASTLYATNRSAAACALQGHPRFQLLDARGLPIQVDDTGLRGAAERIVLQPGQRAAAGLVWRNWCRPEPPLPITLLVTLPGDQAPFSPAQREPGYTPGCEGPDAPSTLVVDPFVRGDAP